ncbi:MAG TPA: glycosyltransferase family 61 protein [Pyrinomonadaceae bacterium]
MAVLCPQTVSRRKPPVNLRQEDLWIFSHELEREIPRSELLELKDVWISSDGFLFKGWKILPQSFALPGNLEEWKKRGVFKFLATNYLFRKRGRFERDAVWVADDWSHGYFHWIADALTRLFTVRDHASELVLLLPHRYEKLGFVRPSLAPFGFKHIEFIREREILHCRRLVVPTHTAPSGNYNEEVIGGVRQLLVEAYGARPEEHASGGRLYISRGHAAIRRLKNEEEVIDVLREFDFEVAHFENYSFEEQVKMASRARNIVSSHGAGLTNMLFMQAGGNVLELRNSTDRINNCYFTLASALNFNYFYQTCEAENPGERAFSANLLVDTVVLRENLKLMLDGDGR